MLGQAPGSTDDTVAPHPLGPVFVLPNETALPGQKSDHFIPRMLFMNVCTTPSSNSTCPATNIRKMLGNLYKYTFEKHPNQAV